MLSTLTGFVLLQIQAARDFNTMMVSLEDGFYPSDIHAMQHDDNLIHTLVLFL